MLTGARGRYRILDPLARGHFCEVFDAVTLDDEERLVVKVPRPDGALTDDALLAEAEVAGALEHDNVMPLVDTGRLDGRVALVFPRGAGTVCEQIAVGMWPSAAIEFARQLLAGLAHVHARGYVHGDIKPDNLIVFGDDLLRIADFGFARRWSPAGVRTVPLTTEYMAPERQQGQVSPRSDVYEAAVVIVEMLSGWLVGDPSCPSLQRAMPQARWARELTPALVRALSPEPAARFLDAGEFARALEQALRGWVVN